MTMSIDEIIKQCMEDSEKYFPGKSKDLLYMVVALTGELGEFCNILKKVERGSIELTPAVHLELSMELVDVFIYLCNCAGIMNVDLGAGYEAKKQYNDERFLDNKLEVKFVPIEEIDPAFDPREEPGSEAWRQ